jgi:hypothetical protein
MHLDISGSMSAANPPPLPAGSTSKEPPVKALTSESKDGAHTLIVGVSAKGKSHFDPITAVDSDKLAAMVLALLPQPTPEQVASDEAAEFVCRDEGLEQLIMPWLFELFAALEPLGFSDGQVVDIQHTGSNQGWTTAFVCCLKDGSRAEPFEVALRLRLDHCQVTVGGFKVTLTAGYRVPCESDESGTLNEICNLTLFSSDASFGHDHVAQVLKEHGLQALKESVRDMVRSALKSLTPAGLTPYLAPFGRRLDLELAV